MASASLKQIEIGGWKPQGVVKESNERLVRSFQDIVDFLIRFGITCLPFLIPLGAGIYFLVRAIRKSISKSRAKKSESSEREDAKISDEIEK